MKYLVAMMVAVTLFGFFSTTNGLSCYKCKWTDEKCATETSDSKLPTVNCSASEVITDQTTKAAAGGDGGAADVTVAPPAPPPPAALKLDSNVNVHKYKNSFLGMADPKFYCFKMNVKANASATTGVERGCKATNTITDCLPSNGVAIYETCKVCDSDNCNGNGQSMITGSAVQCALISSLLVAKMFLHAK